MLTPQEVAAYFEQVGFKPVGERGDWRDAKCVWHEDRARSFSYNVVSGGWVCQAGCGSGGLKEVAEKSGVPFPRSPRPEKERRAAEGKVLERSYDYHDEQGLLLFQVCRFKTKTSKTFLQRHPDGASGWVWNMQGVRVVPYRLPALLTVPKEQPVFVVEGEKDTDALWALGLAATTNHGGAGKWRAEHAKHLAGRPVVVVPDNDAPGRKHVQQVAASLAGLCPEVRVLALPGLPEKGDASDWLAAGGTREALLELAARAPLWKPSAEPPATARAATDAPFLALGYREGTFYYLPAITSQVVALQPQGHGKLNLLALAPLAYWSKHYGGDGPTNWTAAAADCMAFAARAGVFDPNRIRGRGAWYEGGRAVVHLGNRLVVGGEEQAIGIPEPGGFIYPAAIPLSLEYTTPLGNRDAADLAILCDALNWDRPMSGRFLAGWLAIAPICGALKWRPHVWVTGASGAGKSYVVDQIMRPLLGKVGYYVQGASTEAGIRQALGYDARPVLFDEAESKNQRSEMRLEQVMELVRGSSSDGGGVIAKGTASGEGREFLLRAAFAFASIGVGVRQHADATRVTVLSLEMDTRPPKEKEEAFASLCRMTAGLITIAYVSSLHARMIKLIPVVRENAETFARSAAAAIGTRRMGDQIGTLLAGAWALGSERAVTRHEADAWVAKQDWSEQTAVQEAPDEMLCLQHLVQHVERVQTGKGVEEMSIAEMIERSDSSLDPHAEVYGLHLLRIGIRVDRDENAIIVANHHAGIQKIMSGTPWGDWGRTMRRLRGSKATPKPVRFIGAQARGTIIPRKLISN